MTGPLAYVATAAAATAFLGTLVGPGLRSLGLVDRPNARSSHTAPTLRGGGVTFVVVAAASALGRIPVPELIAAVGVAGVSFVDDLRGLSPRVRLVAHAMAATAPAFVAHQAFGHHGAVVAAVCALTAFVGCIGLTNASNFMDGIDGLAASQAAIASLAAGAILASGGDAGAPASVAAFACAGSCLGFLPHNFPRARMFMGDVGSAFLGFIGACFVVEVVRVHGLRALVPAALPHLGFVLDTAITMARRSRAGAVLTEAHREHFYQRGIRSGATHPQMTAIYGIATGASALASVTVVGQPTHRLLAAAAVTVGSWLVLFAAIERRFRHALADGSGNP